MRIHNGKYFYTVEHPKPNLLDIPPSCKDLIKKNDEIYEYDFNKFARIRFVAKLSRYPIIIDFYSIQKGTIDREIKIKISQLFYDQIFIQ